MNKLTRLFLLTLALVVIVGSIAYLESKKTKPLPDTTSTGAVTVGSNYREFENPSAFVNSEPFELADYIGKKVILLDFWTYSCINCQRTTPYLNAWWNEYEDDGLLIVGIHSPEFEFEKELSNVQKAVIEENIHYPVVLDNDKGSWNAYGNRYWPRKYLIDLNGNVVYDLIGEGSYEETEAKIREVLGVTGQMSTVENTMDVDFDKVTSPETYFGSARGKDVEIVSIEPFGLNPDLAYLVGDWDQTKEYATNAAENTSILYRYNAKNVYMVAAADPLSGSDFIEVEVWIDDEYVKTLSISGTTLYPVVEGSDYGAHTLKLIPKSPGLNVFTFTFG